MSKVTNVMATEVALDVMKASTDLKALTQVVSANQAAWKAQTAALKSAGDYVGAYEAKVEGLGDSIKAQGAKLDALKDKQSDLGLETSKDAQKFVELKDKIDELKSKQSDLDQTTEQGKSKFKELGTQISELTEQQDKLSPATIKLAEDYEKYQRQINQTEAQIVSLKAQQDRAKDSLDYQKSGLVEIQQAYENNNRVMQAHVERLKAEGNEDEANRTKLNGLTEGLSKLNEKYDLQVAELERLESAQNRDNEAITTQKVRVDETATAMAKAKTETNELREAMDKKPTGFMAGVRSKLESVNEKAEKTSHLFGKIMGANLIANGITNGLATIQAHFSELTDSVVQYNDKQQVMKSTWDTLTGSAKKGQAMVDMGNKLSAAYNQDINVVDELNQQFYHVLDAKAPTEQLTKSVLTMSDTLGLSAENTKRLGTNFTHMMSSGKMQLGDFNMINDQLPMFSERMLDYERKVQHNSKLTMSNMRDQMSAGKIQAKDAEAVMNELGKKYQSASENLMKTIPGMERSIKTQMPALLNSIYSPIAQMQNPLLGSITKWIGQVKTKDLFKDIGKDLAKQINRITTAFGGKKINISGNLDGWLKNVDKGVRSLGNSIVKNKSSIKGFISTMGVLSKTSFNIFTATLKALLPVLTLVGKLAEKYPRTFTAVASSMLLANKASGMLLASMNNFDKLKDIGKLFAFKDAEGGAVKLGALGKAVKLFGQSFMAVGKFMLKNPFSIAITAASLLAVGFAELYKHSKTFRDAMNKLGGTLKSVFTGSIKWVAEWGKNIKNGWDTATKDTSKGTKEVGGFISNLVTSAGKNLSNLWNGTKTTFKNGWADVTNASKSGAHDVGTWFGNMAKDTQNRAAQMFADHKKTFKAGYDVLNSYTQVWHDVMTGKWDKVGTDLKNTANAIRTLVHNIFSDMYNKLNDMTGGRLGDMVKWWQSKMKAIGTTVSDAKASVHRHFVDLVRGVIKPFNEMLAGLKKGINWVLDKVGASKIGGKWSISMPSYATGTNDTHQGGFAKVNDGAGSNYREMYHLPNGDIGMFPAMKNMIVPLPKGTSVLDGDKSAVLAKAMHLPGYANGVGNFFSGLWKGGKDLLDNSEDILKKPAEFMRSVFNHFLGGASSKISLANDVITNFPKTVAKDAVKWVKKLFDNLGGGDGNSKAGKMSKSDFASVAHHAAQIVRQSLSNGDIGRLYWQAMVESTVNPAQGGGIDDHDGTGRPVGLMQYKLSTWKAWAVKGHANIHSALDQIIAVLNDSNWRQDLAPLGTRRGWGPTGHKMFANGGIATAPSIFGEAGAEMAIPLNTMASSRAWQLLGQVVDYYRGGGTKTTNVMTDNSDVIAELKSVKAYLATLVNVGTGQIAATKAIGTFDPKIQLKYEANQLKDKSWTAM